MDKWLGHFNAVSNGMGIPGGWALLQDAGDRGSCTSTLRNSMKTAIRLGIIMLLTIVPILGHAQAATNPPPASYEVVHRDANSEVLQETRFERSKTGKLIPRVRSVTRLETGLNYWDGKKWTPGDATFHLSAGGEYVYANKLQAKVRLSANLAESNSVVMTTPDGIVLNTTPVAIGLYDAVSGNSMIIAAITNCTGTLISSNEVLYENAFDGVSGDILYTLAPGSFSQDVIWRENIDPADYGFPTNSSRIQIFTAFNSPAPKQIARLLRVETNQTIRNRMATPDLIDHTLKFGRLKFGPGHAFATTSASRFNGAPVAKDFETINGQSYLIESVEYTDVKNALQSLPRRVSIRAAKMKMMKSLGKHYAEIPAPHSTAKATFAIKVGGNMLADAMRAKGVIADYVNYVYAGPDPMILQGDTTYLVSGAVDCDDLVVEGGTVVKYANDEFPVNEIAYIEVDGNLTCETSPYLPAIFTAGDDDSVGNTMNGFWMYYSGTISPGGYGDPCLVLLNPSSLENCRFFYARQAVQSLLSYQTNTFYDCQIANSVTGLSPDDASFTLENCLVANVTNLVDDAVSGNCALSLLNCTVDNCMTVMVYQASDSLNATNSIFSNIGSLTNTAGAGLIGGLFGSNNGFYSSSGFINFAFGGNQFPDYSNPYQTVGGGNYYLADGTFRSQGTGNTDPALLSDLAQKTTWPPRLYDAADISSLGTLTQQALRDTNSAPDLGYHYDSLDYMFAGCDLEANLFVAAGTAIGFYIDNDENSIADSITLNDGGGLYLDGTVTQPCIFTRQVMVQENGNINWFNNNTAPLCGALTFNGSGDWNSEPQLFATFSKWTGDRSQALFWQDNFAWGSGNIVNSEFYDSSMSEYDMQYMYFNNCLFFRALNEYWDWDYDISFTYGNCTFYDGGLLYQGGPESEYPSLWQIENCTFDGTAISWTENNNGAWSIGYNAYNTNNLSWESYGYGFGGVNEVVGPDDVTTTNYNWESGLLGSFYLPTNSPLVKAGNTTADQVGLYEYTTQTNETPEETNVVDIGYHYVATDDDGDPLDTYVPGMPNYIADSAGDGMDPNGLPYWWEGEYLGQVYVNPNSDPYGQGYSLWTAYANGWSANDLSQINPTMLGSWSFDNTNAWTGDQGQQPLVATNIIGMVSWETNAVMITNDGPLLPPVVTNNNLAVTVSGADAPYVDTTFTYSTAPLPECSSGCANYSNIWMSGVEDFIGQCGDWKIVNFVSGAYANLYQNTNGLDSAYPPVTGWTMDAGGLEYGDRVPPASVNLLMISNASDLMYGNLQPGGEANFNLRQGTISFWFLPNWASTNAGGDGPRSEGRFIEIGNRGTASGWWGLVVDSAGTNIYFGTQTNSISTLTTNVVAPISWMSNVWHQVVLTYTQTNSAFYVDGQPVATNGSGVLYYPSLAVQANGFNVGGSLLGTNQAAGTFDELYTYNYPLTAGTIFTNYETAYTADTNGDGLPDIWEDGYFGTLNINTNGIDPDGLETFQNYLLGLSPITDETGQVNLRANYTYTAASWLESISGTRNGTITTDNEGNIKTVSQ